jgi:isochorismate hydrolase/uncharacterized protein YndB with AHSA1/START domain
MNTKITTIDPYPMPAEGSLPRNLAGWKIDSARAVLLLHDMQDYFLRTFRQGAPPVTDLVDNARRLRERSAELDIPVVYTAQPGAMSPEQRGLLRDFWGPGMSADPADTKIVDELQPSAGDTLVTKWRYSAFVRSGLEEVIRETGRDQLLIAGVYASLGCLLTAADAYSRDIQPFLVADALADFSAEDHRSALDYAARCCAAVVSTGQTLAALSGETRGEAGSDDGDGTFSIQASTEISADPATVFEYVSDLARSGQWSPECQGGTWVQGRPGALGSVFRGRNYRGTEVVPWAPVVRGEWTTESEVVESVPPRKFAWAMRDSSGRKQESVWSFHMAPSPGGSRLVHRFWMGELTEGMREILARAGREQEQKFITDWSAKLQADMGNSLARIKHVLESAARKEAS